MFYDYFFLRLFLSAPLFIASYMDLKELRVKNSFSFSLIFFGSCLFISELQSSGVSSIFLKLLISMFITSYLLLNIIGGADFKIYIYLLLVLDVRLFILIFFLSLLLGGLVIELNEKRTPLIPIITIVTIIVIAICR